MGEMPHTCMITMGDFGNYYKCGRPAKAVIHGDRMYPDGLYVCGVHQVAIDRRKKRLGLPQCERLKEGNRG